MQNKKSLLIKGSHVSNTVKNRRLNPLEKKLMNRTKGAKKEVLELAKAGSTLLEISEKLNITPLSTAIYLERLLKKGELIDASNFVKKNRIYEIKNLIESKNTLSIKKLIEFSDKKILEEELRIVRGEFIFEMSQRDLF